MPVSLLRNPEEEMSTSDTGWIAVGEYRVYDKHWNQIIDVVSCNPETGEVCQKMAMHDDLVDSSNDRVAIVCYPTPLHVVPKV
jgi:hypothetical protein